MLVTKVNKIMVGTYFLAYCTKYAKGFSQVYILITCIPEMISFIKRTLSSVLMAVFSRSSEVFFPSQPTNEIFNLFISFFYR